MARCRRSWIEGPPARYFAKIEREGPWWNVTFRDCPGCITFGRGRHEALAMAADALAAWCADVPPMKLLVRSGPEPGEVLITARFGVSPDLTTYWGGARSISPLTAFWRNRGFGWR